jgi:HEPN domain-containing protein
MSKRKVCKIREVKGEKEAIESMQQIADSYNKAALLLLYASKEEGVPKDIPYPFSIDVKITSYYILSALFCATHSVEMYLKTLLGLKKGRYKEIHSLDELFQDLPDEIKTEIKREVPDTVSILNVLKNYSTETRYPKVFEFKIDIVKALVELNDCLRKHINNIKKNNNLLFN